MLRNINNSYRRKIKKVKIIFDLIIDNDHYLLYFLVFYFFSFVIGFQSVNILSQFHYYFIYT